MHHQLQFALQSPWLLTPGEIYAVWHPDNSASSPQSDSWNTFHICFQFHSFKSSSCMLTLCHRLTWLSLPANAVYHILTVWATTCKYHTQMRQCHGETLHAQSRSIMQVITQHCSRPSITATTCSWMLHANRRSSSTEIFNMSLNWRTSASLTTVCVDSKLDSLPDTIVRFMKL